MTSLGCSERVIHIFTYQKPFVLLGYTQVQPSEKPVNEMWKIGFLIRSGGTCHEFSPANSHPFLTPIPIPFHS